MNLRAHFSLRPILAVRLLALMTSCLMTPCLITSCTGESSKPVMDVPVTTTADTTAQPARSTDTATPPIPVAARQAEFANRLWVVQASSAVAPGTTYSFRSDGVLLIESPQGEPARGAWTYMDGELVMIEEGRPYPTEILALDAETFRIRSINPGGAVEITLVPAP